MDGIIGRRRRGGLHSALVHESLAVTLACGMSPVYSAQGLGEGVHSVMISAAGTLD